MSHAVYEEEYLGNFPRANTFSAAEVPLPLPETAADHQGLYLSTDGDQLIGRAENGKLSLFLYCITQVANCALPLVSCMTQRSDNRLQSIGSCMLNMSSVSAQS